MNIYRQLCNKKKKVVNVLSASIYVVWLQWQMNERMTGWLNEWMKYGVQTMQKFMNIKL